MIGGVCAGLAAFLNVDLTVVRIVTLLTLLLYGTGFLVYLVLWIVVPVAKTPADKCMMRGFEPTAENMARFSGQRRNGLWKIVLTMSVPRCGKGCWNIASCAF